MTHRRFSRGHVVGATQLALVLSVGGATRAVPTSLPLHREDAKAASSSQLPPIQVNDNRLSAGRLDGNVLTVRLETRKGMWYPEGARGMALPVYAFAEEGMLPQNPGPVIRVRAGTEVRAFVRNTLQQPLTLFGLTATRGIAGDSLVVAPGSVREIRFRPTVPGTFYYAGRTGKSSLFGRLQEDSQLNGAIVVDPPGTTPVPNARVFLISWWVAPNPESPTGLERATLVINGLSWPHTERIDAAQGDSLRWRWINTTDLPHPLHLHGFYFRVDGVGNGSNWMEYARSERRRAVTEVVSPGGTMAMTWSPERPGNWIFHCHFVGHISHLVSLGTRNGFPASEESGHAHDGTAATRHQMAGLVLGIRVAPHGPVVAASKRDYRSMRLLVRSKPNVYGTQPGYAYVLGGTPAERDTTRLTLPGPTLVLEKGQPVAVTVVNQSHAPAAVHWHGIELESFPDGVPGWSGSGSSILPAIAPNDSLTVRFTPPRAGTFMYHSHFDEFGQIASGLYGSIVVVEPGHRYDGTTDRVLLFSDDGPTTNVLMGPFPRALMNGQAQPEPLELRAGVTYRFRLINIRTDYPASFTILDDGQPAQWRVVAKDGADLPSVQMKSGPATIMFAAGEIYDVEFTPQVGQALAMQFGAPKLGPIPGQATYVQVRVR